MLQNEILSFDNAHTWALSRSDSKPLPRQRLHTAGRADNSVLRRRGDTATLRAGEVVRPMVRL